MDPLNQIRLYPLINISRGQPDITIGVIDGPVDFSHPAFQESNIDTVENFQLSA
jgi:subtilisin family serine protease